MKLRIEKVGEFRGDDGKPVIGVLLTGDREAVKAAASLFGEDVRVVAASETPGQPSWAGNPYAHGIDD